VAEVFTGTDDNEAIALRLEGLSASYTHPPGGWVSTTSVDVTIVGEAMPKAPGLYWQETEEDQVSLGNFHTDGREFYYLNTSKEWVDIGFGFPSTDRPFNRMDDVPF
jgi:hypothetical protein